MKQIKSNPIKAVALLTLLATVLVGLCSCGPHTHSFEEWTVTKAATCTDPGEQERVCSCGEKEVKTVDPLGHSTRQGKCSTCGKFINELASEVDALSEFISNVSLATNLIKNVYLATMFSRDTYIASRDTYIEAVDPDLQSISGILSKYPKEFTEFRSLFESMMKEIDNAMVGWENVDGFSYGNCKILQEVSDIFINARPQLNGALGKLMQK